MCCRVAAYPLISINGKGKLYVCDEKAVDGAVNQQAVDVMTLGPASSYSPHKSHSGCCQSYYRLAFLIFLSVMIAFLPALSFNLRSLSPKNFQTLLPRKKFEIILEGAQGR